MITGVAHAGVCVDDVDAAVRWYTEVLGLRLLSPPYRMAGEAIERDMGELVPSPVVVKAAIVGVGDDDHVLELLEYPSVERGHAAAPIPRPVVEPGLSHIGLTCDDIVAARERLEAAGVTFLTSGIADVAGVRTTWLADPWGNVVILVEKRRPDRPYWRQHGSP